MDICIYIKHTDFLPFETAEAALENLQAITEGRITDKLVSFQQINCMYLRLCTIIMKIILYKYTYRDVNKI